MLELEKKYLNILNIDYEAKRSDILNFKCPICGDGDTGHKKRGFILKKDDSVFYNCFNECGSMSMYKFLQYQDENLAREYYKESIKDKFVHRKENKEVFKKKSLMVTKPFNHKEVVITLKEKDKTLKLTNIKVSKKAKDYLKSRGFKINELDKYSIYYNKEMNALVFPLYTTNKKDTIYGVQVRLIDKKHFINITYDAYKYYGEYLIETAHYGSDIFVFESIFDMISSGLDNSIAMLGSDMSEEILERFKDFNLVFAFDNDKAGRNKTIKYGELGYNCLVHTSNNPFKDFNAMLQKGIAKSKIARYILSNIKFPKMSVLKTRLNHNYKLFDWN